ncbi:MAG: integrin alpha, partial [Planctomycetes bacterium]|nr:integrin alpha [Planctomycetota bacterium]
MVHSGISRPAPPRESVLRVLGGLGFFLACGSTAGGQSYILRQYDGPAPYEQLGTSVAGAGDVNGDGFSDLLVGATQTPFSFGWSTVVGPGRADLFSGSSGAVLLSFVGSGSDGLGRAVSGGTDVSGDGVPDILVGAPEIGPGTGYAKLFSGSDGSTLLTLDGALPDEQFGAAVAIAGDATGDGVPELLIGARGAAAGGLTNSGRALVFSGATGGILYVFLGTSAGDVFGTAVGGKGDANGDGVADFLIGAPQGASGPGYVRIHSGANGTLLQTFTGAFPAPGSPGFGTSVAWT